MVEDHNASVWLWPAFPRDHSQTERRRAGQKTEGEIRSPKYFAPL